MEFDNSFRVAAPVDDVYEALLDLERVTPAMPGASVLEKTGDDSYKVAIKVKLGPVTMNYRGDVTIVEKDPAAHSAVLDVKARESRGQGSATAKVRMGLTAAGSGTEGTMRAEVALSGKAASMSRGVIDDVSRRLVTTFAGNLEGILAGPEGSAPTAAGEADGKPSGGEGAAATNGGEAEAPPKPPPPSSAQPGREPSRPAEDDVFDAGSLAASMAADRLRDPKVLGVALAAALLAGYLIGRRS